jgi:hypothetical protein
MENLMPNEVAKINTANQHVFSCGEAFENAQRIAGALSKSMLVPEAYRNNLPNSLVALEVAQRIGASPLMVMQNLHVIHGRPSWSSQFVIAALNSCGRFSPLRFRMEGEGDTRSCTAWAEDAKGEKLEGPTVSIEIAQKEGWYDKKGSKWQTIPELMLRYRAAAFFGRLYAPEILMGMHTEEEVVDFGDKVIDVTPANPDSSSIIDNINSKIKQGADPEPQGNAQNETPDPDDPAKGEDASGTGFDVRGYKIATKAGTEIASRELINRLTDLPAEERPGFFQDSYGGELIPKIDTYGLTGIRKEIEGLGIKLPPVQS